MAVAKRPFWMHQIVEYILGVALIATGLQSPTPIVPGVLGLLIILNAAITKGPVGAFRVLSKKVHRIIDVGLIALTFVAAFQPWLDTDSGVRLIVVFIGVVYAFVWWQSNFAEKVKGPKVSAEGGGRSTEVGRFAGRLVGNGVNAVRRPRGDDR
jgi:hypothetical protein